MFVFSWLVPMQATVGAHACYRSQQRNTCPFGRTTYFHVSLSRVNKRTTPLDVGACFQVLQSETAIGDRRVSMHVFSRCESRSTVL